MGVRIPSLAKARWKRSAVLLLSGSLIVWVGADRLVAALFERLRPELEQKLSEPLGHPLKIGDYRGLRPLGLAIGPTEVLPGPKDNSRASLEGLTVSLAPLASLIRLRPVAVVTLEGSRLTLRRNNSGSYWVPGPTKGEPPPKIDLRLRFTQPARVNIQPANLKFTANARADVQLAQGWVKGAAQLGLPDQGRLFLEGSGRWDRLELDVRVRLEKIRLKQLQGLLPGNEPLQLQGQIGGDFQLSLQQGRVGCDGALSLVGFQLRGGSFPESLSSREARISCREDQLQLPLSHWRYGPWTASVQGGARLNNSYGIDLKVNQQHQGHAFQARIDGPWHEPRLRASGRWSLDPKSPVDGPLQMKLQMRTNWRNPKTVKAILDSLEVNSPGLKVRARGPLYPQLGVSTQRLELAGTGWKSIPLLSELLGNQSLVKGRVQLEGASFTPKLQLALAQQRNPLLEHWSLQAGWSAESGLLRIKQFSSPQLNVVADMPLSVDQGRLLIGELQAELNLSPFPLARVGSLLDTSMAGTLAASGQVRGPLWSIRPNLFIRVVNPEVGRLRLREAWQGNLSGLPTGGGILRMTSAGAVIPGQLSSQLGRNWLPKELTISRGAGELSLDGTPASYRWQLNNFSVEGVEVAMAAKQRFEGIYGQFSGSGSLGLQPLAVDGQVTISHPGLMGIQLRQALLQGKVANHSYELTGEFLPPDTGQITLDAQGQLGGELSAKAEARGLSARWLTSTAQQLATINDVAPPAVGDARDLGTLLVQTFGGSLDGQLKALVAAHSSLNDFNQRNRQSKVIHPEDLQGQMDAVIDLKGPDLAKLKLELKAKGHLWREGEDQDHALQIKPLFVTIQGPLHGGGGTFSLLHVPFSLLSLVAPLPTSLRGALGLSGRYNLGDGSPQLTADLVLENAKLADSTLNVDKGQISLADSLLKLDLALRSSSSQEPVTVIGQVPLDPSLPIDVRVESHGDGLRFLDGFAEGALTWKGGSSDLSLLLSGSLSSPQANGFLVMENGEFVFMDQAFKELEAKMFFDFNRLEVQHLKAKIGANGILQGAGAIALLRPAAEEHPLTIEISKSRFKLPMADVAVDANLKLRGALLKPLLGGEVTIDDGAITPAGSGLMRPITSVVKSTKRSGSGLALVASSSSKVVDANTLLEQQWDFKKPLVLLGPDVDVNRSEMLRSVMPNIPAVRFDNLRLKLGPDLRISAKPLANFRTQGLLTLNGSADPNLQVRGVVWMLSGRLNLFTTTFSLDRRTPNVAVFTPSQGLIPYVDVAMTSQVSDSVSLGTDSDAASSNVFDINGTGALGVGGQLRMIKVMVNAEGPADRLWRRQKGSQSRQYIQLRSSPSLPRAQLLGLIGGNSLAGLSGDDSGAALATVIGQSLLTPLLGTISDAFSQRMQITLSPTYVSPEVTSKRERVSGQVPPSLELVTNIGIDVTERLNLSVLTTPDRSAIPPQGTLTYQISPNIDLSGSVDSQGTWQSQLQLFFRF
ncbi:MAG TPA: translocation/assembly module TamB domain-containing protein [Prochlorococcus sp.]